MDSLDREQQLRWRDQLGNTYRVEQMETSHIRNSMKYLMRHAQRVYDERTVDSTMKVVADPELYASVTDSVAAAMQEYMFGHLRVKPTEWVRRLDIMWAFHHELQRRQRRLDELKNEGRAIFEFPS